MSSSNTREIKDVFYLVALQGINYVMPLVVFPYLMTVLGSEKFGYIGFATALIQFFMLIVDFGFNFTATKQVAIYRNDPDKLKELFWSILFAKIGLLFISFLMLLALMFSVPQFSVYRTTTFIFFFMVVANTFSFVWFFQGLGKIRVISIVNIISKLLILPMIFWLVKTPDDYLKAAFIQSSVYLFGALLACAILFFGKMLPPWQQPAGTKIFSESKSAFPIFLSSVATSLYVALFAVILGYFSTPEEVGKYTAAEKIVRSFCYLVFIPVSQAFFPKVSTMSQNSGQEARRLIQRIAIFVSVIMGFIFILLFFFSEYIMLFLGKDYNGIETIFKIMATIPLFVALGGVFGQLGLLALGNERDKKYYQHVYFIAGAVALASIFALVPTCQAVGAAVALVITEFTVFGGMLYCYKRLEKK